ncbi:hypothetical protein QNO07_09970 [Streptomyces sp. 549]|nr:hypothetical protein [Streptomyces sp. 549]
MKVLNRTPEEFASSFRNWQSLERADMLELRTIKNLISALEILLPYLPVNGEEASTLREWLSVRPLLP